MKIGALFVAAASAGPCPSTDCWSYDPDNNECDLIPTCVEVTCNPTDMEVGYKLGVFGTTQDSANAGGALVPGDASDMYRKTIALAEATLDFTNPTNLEFKTRVELGGGQSNRARTDTVDTEIELDTGLKIITTPFGVGVDFSCKYDSAFSVSSADFTVEDISITGEISSNGDLTNSMTMVAGDPDTATVLGNDVKVSTTWALALTDVSFHYKACAVTQGTKTVELIKDGCRSSILGVEHVGRLFANKIEMKYKSFMIDGETATQQSVTCDIQICDGLQAATTHCESVSQPPACNTLLPETYGFEL